MTTINEINQRVDRIRVIRDSCLEPINNNRIGGTNWAYQMLKSAPPSKDEALKNDAVEIVQNTTGLPVEQGFELLSEYYSLNNRLLDDAEQAAFEYIGETDGNGNSNYWPANRIAFLVCNNLIHIEEAVKWLQMYGASAENIVTQFDIGKRNKPLRRKEVFVVMVTKPGEHNYLFPESRIYGYINDERTTLAYVDTNGLPPFVRTIPASLTDEEFYTQAYDFMDEVLPQLPGYTDLLLRLRSPSSFIGSAMAASDGKFPWVLSPEWKQYGHAYRPVVIYYGFPLDRPREYQWIETGRWTLEQMNAAEAQKRHGVDMWIVHGAIYLGESPPENRYVFVYELTVDDVAEQLGLSPKTIRNQINNGRINAIKFRRDWFIHPYEVDRYREEHLGKVGQKLD